jgi:DNA recombination protein RmuC
MIVRLPGGRRIAVDAKAPLAGYLASVEATNDVLREQALDEHVTALRGHVRTLASRDYQTALGAGVDLVVLFLPGDPFLAAAFSRAPEMQIEALRQHVLIATPTTLFALLRTVAIYHQQEALARNAQEIAKTAQELYERGAKFGEDLSKLGKSLQSAFRAYNEAVGSFDSRFVPMARRLEEMSVTEHATRALVAPERVDETVRAVRNAPPDVAP